MTGAIREIIKYKGFLKELVKRDFKRKYYKSVLGVLWTLLNPLLMMTVKMLVFSYLFSKSIENYPVYYLCGWLLFNFNSDATNQGLHSIVSNSVLIKKIYIPPYIFCVSTTILALINKLIAMLPLFVIMAITGVPFRWTLLLIPLLIVPLFFFSMGISLALSAMGVYFRDLFHLYSSITLAWMYLTPIFYPIEIVPERFLILWNFNPLFHFANIMRGLVLYGTLPDPVTIIYALTYSALAMGLGVTLYAKLEKNFSLHI